jgi:hypothetical protein
MHRHGCWRGRRRAARRRHTALPPKSAGPADAPARRGRPAPASLPRPALQLAQLTPRRAPRRAAPRSFPRNQGPARNHHCHLVTAGCRPCTHSFPGGAAPNIAALRRRVYWAGQRAPCTQQAPVRPACAGARPRGGARRTGRGPAKGPRAGQRAREGGRAMRGRAGGRGGAPSGADAGGDGRVGSAAGGRPCGPARHEGGWTSNAYRNIGHALPWRRSYCASSAGTEPAAGAATASTTGAAAAAARLSRAARRAASPAASAALLGGCSSSGSSTVTPSCARGGDGGERRHGA